MRIYDYAELPAATLNAAERQAENIFGQAGVELRWVECGVSPEETAKLAACDQVSGRPHSAVVKLIPPSMEERFPRPTEQFATAIPSTVFVFCRRIHDAAEMSGIPEPLMLGVILAHELGHEVLGASSHSAFGIMKPTLQAEDFELAGRGRLRFTTEEARRLHSKL